MYLGREKPRDNLAGTHGRIQRRPTMTESYERFYIQVSWVIQLTVTFWNLPLISVFGWFFLRDDLWLMLFLDVFTDDILDITIIHNVLMGHDLYVCS